MIREDRYFVIKRKDAVAALTTDEHILLSHLCGKINGYRLSIDKLPTECVVVEADWPEYEPTWRAIERRVDGRDALKESDSITERSDWYEAMAEVSNLRKRAEKAESLASYARDHFTREAEAHTDTREKLAACMAVLLDVPTPLVIDRSPLAEELQDWRSKHAATIAAAGEGKP